MVYFDETFVIVPLAGHFIASFKDRESAVIVYVG